VARIDVASIDTGVGLLDRLLRAPRILHAERYPHKTFESSGVEHVGGTLLKVRGGLTVREVTRAVVLEVEYRGVGPSGRARFGAWSEIDRAEFIHWRELLGISRWRVGRRMRIELAIEAEREGGPAEAGPPPS
jgi:polyisoprenoid-binding protein YceI